MRCTSMQNRIIFASLISLAMSACSTGVKEVPVAPVAEIETNAVIDEPTIDEPVSVTPEVEVAVSAPAAPVSGRLSIPKRPGNRLSIPEPASTSSFIPKRITPTAIETDITQTAAPALADLNAPAAETISAADALDPQALRAGQLDSFREAVNANRSEPTRRKPQAEALNITLTTLRAERGDLQAQVALGKAYAYGTPRLEQDPVQAKAWFELASLKGDAEAQYELGQLFYSGSGVDLDYFNAREWWIESALQGNLDAQQKLGYLYSEGLGVDQDYDKAKDWYLRAAKRGHAEAQTLLGSLYHEGNRIPADLNEAFKWYKLAAEQGHAHAQYTLATLYHDGRGTQVDYIQCAAWVDVAIANGFDDELNAKGNCRGQLDELSNLTATHLANTWKKRYLSDGVTL